AIHHSVHPPKEAGNLTVKLSYDAELAERGAASRLQSRPGVLTGFAAPDCLAYAYERTADESYLKAGLRGLEAFLDDNPAYNHTRFHGPIPTGKPFAMAYRTWINYLAALDRCNLLKQFDYAEL
ncbi:MAG: hypothetical protein ACK5LK_01650, partial [Chthoniobacterales bacterium]